MIKNISIIRKIQLSVTIFIFLQVPYIALSQNLRGDISDIMSGLFKYNVFTSPSQSVETYVTVYYSIPNDVLLFTKQDTLFNAGFEITIALLNKNNEPVKTKIIQKNVTAQTFSETNSKNIYTKDQVTFLVKPGNYRLILNVMDLSTRKPVTLKENISIPDFKSKPLKCTKIRFYTKTKSRLPQEKDFPVFPPVRGPEDSLLWTQFYLYTKEKALPHKVIYTISNVQGKNVYSDSIKFVPNSNIKSLLYSIGQPFSAGKYFLEIFITNGKYRTSLSEYFFIRGKGQTALISDISSFIKPMQYIMDKKLYKKLITSDIEQQKTILTEFWKERDPEPSTEINELENEFYRRVNYTNQHFSLYKGGKDGWHSDRGRIYIIYGAPSQIETMSSNRSFASVSRYEIWYYTNIGKKFVFYDKFGNNNFLLVSEE